MNQPVYHIPALLEPSLNGLNIQEDGIYVDATYGGGGHTGAIVQRLGKKGHVFGFDQDEDAVKRALIDERFTMVYGNFRFMKNFLRFYGVEKVNGILADLGVSFHHFDDAERGFSFRSDARLDMRMNRHGRLSAVEVINDYTEERLSDIFYLYGEMPKARQIARAIVRSRSNTPITTINNLLEVVAPFIDKRREKKELACLFQALRIEVNGELDALREFLSQTIEVLPAGGRLTIITYHSLEDRLVKNFMRSGNFTGIVEKDIFGRAEVPFRLLGSKPIVASEEEIAANPRSRSAKLRVATRN